MIRPTRRGRARLLTGALAAALLAAHISPPAALADKSYSYSTSFDWGCNGWSYTEWAGPNAVTGVLNHEKWIRDGTRWVRANARRTTDGPQTQGRISHNWSGSRGRTNRITAIHTWSDRAGVFISSTGDFFCP